jgi:hypothetical protein
LNEEFVLVFYATDYFVTEEEIKWIKKLNSNKLSIEFENWRSNTKQKYNKDQFL